MAYIRWYMYIHVPLLVFVYIMILFICCLCPNRRTVFKDRNIYDKDYCSCPLPKSERHINTFFTCITVILLAMNASDVLFIKQVGGLKILILYSTFYNWIFYVRGKLLACS